MEIGTVYGGYYGAKGYKGVRKEEKRADAGFAGKVAEKETLSQKDMTLDEYKAYFNEKMNSLYTHPSQRGMWTGWVGCAGIYVGVPDGADQHGVPECIFICRHD